MALMQKERLSRSRRSQAARSIGCAFAAFLIRNRLFTYQVTERTYKFKLSSFVQNIKEWLEICPSLVNPPSRAHDLRSYLGISHLMKFLMDEGDLWA